MINKKIIVPPKFSPLFFSLYITMSLRFIRSLHYKRVPNYDGWWTQILNASIEPHATLKIEQVPTRVPISIPFEQIQQEPTLVPTIKTTVYLNKTPIELPQKPEAPDNCCMR